MLIKTANGWITLAKEAIPAADKPKPDLTPDWLKYGYSSFDAWLNAWGDAILANKYFPTSRWDRGIRQ